MFFPFSIGNCHEIAHLAKIKAKAVQKGQECAFTDGLKLKISVFPVGSNLPAC